MDVATRYLEAIPLWNISAKSVASTSVKFFTSLELPRTNKHHQGSNFTRRFFFGSLEKSWYWTGNVFGLPFRVPRDTTTANSEDYMLKYCCHDS
ncbi:hypothetical protein HOLleu_09491 [Holothuria leucospilota]|uniref:Uncharacterized protein n=1 Tax=Holothuria leucospilota TaxID=206669 RepID=A0A9Q1HDY1_HOLLE|nr:hypothetical protein HOLleu_09491 [Holothuria leucospilota]